MEHVTLSDTHKNILQKFTQGLKDIYREEVVAVILYGSAVSGEFVERHSNLNLLVVLKNADLDNLKKSSKLIRKFTMINTLFLSEKYIAGALDIFPIEFLDMQENHLLMYGKDILEDITIDIRNLRFQCEQELKEKLIGLQHAYLRLQNNPSALRTLLFTSFTSILHIIRNVLRLKGGTPPYLKSEILKALSSQCKIDISVWQKILAAKNKQIKLSYEESEELFVTFVRELEAIVTMVDQG